MEINRCTHHEKNLPKKFWAEVANTVVFLQNRIPRKTVKDQTPFETWYGYKPSLKILKVFGCLCFTYILQIKREKLDKKAKSGIFIHIVLALRLIGCFNHKLDVLLITKMFILWKKNNGVGKNQIG